MKKVLGILGLLVAICLYTGFRSDQFVMPANIENLVHRTALFGILSIGAAFVIITGGIDLSIGSMVCLVGVALPWLLVHKDWSVAGGVATVLGAAVAIGLIHGLLITKARLQPFIVTLCGLLLYRGIARGLTDDQSQGFGRGFKPLRALATERLPIFGRAEGVFHLPSTFLILLILAAIAAVFLNKTIYGRYLLALGRNEQAARYSGIATGRMIVLAYVICSALAGFGGMLFVLDINAAQPVDFGSFYELYAIAAAVLGGCSLRGGEGSILGIVLGAILLQVLQNLVNLLGIPSSLNFAVMGTVILIGVLADQQLTRLRDRKRTR